MLAQLDRIKAQLTEELDRQAAAITQQAAELEARKAEAEKPAQVLADDSREALGQIMPIAPVLSEKSVADENARRFIDSLEPEPVIDAPAPLDETPCAEDLAQTIADIREVPVETAIQWLAERADEFKNLNKLAKESTK
jgi:light-regulated signal transduction histidine kinase (bacteriophytochrome)